MAASATEYKADFASGGSYIIPDKRRATEVAVAVHALDRMLEFGRPSYVRVA